ncbi:GDP-mannose-dependent alpha-(1-6)-phosphatidylinositol monomannoside mannosyltransferase [Chlamydia abortus]|uniref:Glycosyltransferase n=1 Tax=Paenibacillus residui TaxID=629724 RepID=A0ABW3DGC2_9BACL|nr:glycosyltransferase [Paenibacillus sp. 32O-W]SHE11709.1 GDP-mannose-dependent alpha-(1-6)-phosphatidylinositol monomannoside mannosyltransferase [Chlamydia abortus]
MTRVAYVSTYVPQKCGLATFTFHLRQAVNEAKGRQDRDPVVVPVQPAGEWHEDAILWPLRRDRLEDYAKMARRINRSGIDVVSLQHEFGIFGGEAGAYVLNFVRQLEKPLVTTFHTVFEHPRPPYDSIQKEIAERSDKIVVMNRKAIDYLHEAFGVPRSKIVFIPHGTPEPNPELRQEWRSTLNWSDRKVLMTFGLLSRGKGLEWIIEILPEIVKRVPQALYAIVGQTHPEVKRQEGERYREQLRGRIEELGLEQHVIMIDRYMDEPELVKHLTACDIYVTPYPGLQQITSGTLAYAVGLGRPVVSSPYSYATDLLADYPELLLDPGDSDAWINKITELLADDAELEKWSRKIGFIGQNMHWPEVGRRHAELFSEVRALEYVR